MPAKAAIIGRPTKDVLPQPATSNNAPVRCRVQPKLRDNGTSRTIARSAPIQGVAAAKIQSV